MMVQCCEFLVLISSSSSFYSLRRHGGTIQGGLARQANQGANRVDAGDRRLANVQGDAPGSATLSPHPRALLELWEEWMHGIGGRKPAREFTSAERNNTPRQHQAEVLPPQHPLEAHGWYDKGWRHSSSCFP